MEVDEDKAVEQKEESPATPSAEATATQAALATEPAAGYGAVTSNTTPYVSAEAVAAEATETEGTSKVKRWTWKKPPGKPKRPLSAYNMFFADVRKELMEEQSKTTGGGDPKQHKLGFTELALEVSKRWKAIPTDQKQEYEKKAKAAKEKYQEEILKWRQGERVAALEAEDEAASRVATIAKTQEKNEKSSAASSVALPMVNTEDSDCSTCPVCRALAAEKGLPEPHPIVVVASKEYLSGLFNAATPKPPPAATQPTAADLAAAAVSSIKEGDDEAAKPGSEEEDRKPAATTTNDDEKDAKKELMPTVSVSVMPDGSVFQTRIDMPSGSESSAPSPSTPNQAKLQQDISALWIQLRVARHHLLSSIAAHDAAKTRAEEEEIAEFEEELQAKVEATVAQHT